MNWINRTFVVLIILGLGMGTGFRAPRMLVEPPKPEPVPMPVQKPDPPRSVQPAVQDRAITHAPTPERETWNISAYCSGPCCCKPFSDGITANGHRIKPGDRFIAAPKSIPFGTWITVPGYGRAQVLDRGGAIKGQRLDIFFDDKDGISGHQRALNWGRQHLNITIERN